MAIKDSIQRLLGREGATIGLDIGHSSVKGVHVEKSGSGFQLIKADIEPIADAQTEQGNQDRTVAAIETLISRLGVSGDRVVTCVSGESVIVRPVPIPFLEKKQDLGLAVESEARDFIPFDMRDVILDYQRLRQVELPSGPGEEVLVVAARRETVENHLRMLERARVEAGVVDVGGIALVNALLAGCELGEEETVALVNMGCEVTNIAIVRNNTIRFTRDLNVAGRNITRAVMSELKTEFARSEELKAEYGLKALFGEVDETPTTESEETEEDDSGSIVSEVYRAIDALQGEMTPTESISTAGGEAAGVAAACEQVLSDISSELRRSLLYYENQMDGESTDRVLLAGGTALLPGIARYFEQNLEIPVHIMQPLERIKNNYDDSEKKRMGPMLATGIGLALRCAA
jgi:type IV pilus assembly protein PilM